MKENKWIHLYDNVSKNVYEKRVSQSTATFRQWYEQLGMVQLKLGGD